MTFRFNWKFFNVEELYENTKVSMTQSIAQSKRPPEIVKPIRVVDIDFGDTPPELALHSIQEIEETRAHLVFKLKYSGSAKVALESVVQANPLLPIFNALKEEYPEWIRPKIVAAHSGLQLPFSISLSSVQLDTLVDVIYTKSGVVVTFRNDPVRGVLAESSLDSIPGVSKMINDTIKVALGETFEEDVPETIFKTSSPEQSSPDPSYGARRALSQHIRHTRFIELGLHIRTPVQYRPYHTLSLGADIKHTIPSRHCLKKQKKSSSGEPVSVEDLLERSPSAEPGDISVDSLGSDVGTLNDWVSSLPRVRSKPHRRVFKLRQQTPETPTLTYSESPVFESPPSSSHSRYSIPPLLVRRHSNPEPDELTFEGYNQIKNRAAFFQPSLRPQF